jgi:hypothetical protein
LNRKIKGRKVNRKIGRWILIYICNRSIIGDDLGTDRQTRPDT